MSEAEFVSQRAKNALAAYETWQRNEDVPPFRPTPLLSHSADYSDGLATLADDQHALDMGAGLTYLPGRGVVSVTGPQRLEWLTTLSSQVVTDMTVGDSAELLLLDANGHISHAAGITDDGTTTWLLTDVGAGGALAQFLESMRFMYQVEVHDCSEESAQIGITTHGSIFQALSHTDIAPHIHAIWKDPWPGITQGGASYVKGEHPATSYHAGIIVVPKTDYRRIGDLICERAAQLGTFPTETDEGYRVLAPRWCAMAAWEARRVMAWRPRFGREVDAKSLPHELDWLRTAVHTDKGCYCGQETVARIINLGKPPRRLVFVELDGEDPLLPLPGAAVMVKDRPVGVLTSVATDSEEGPIGLAVIRRGIHADEASVAYPDPMGEDDTSTSNPSTPQGAKDPHATTPEEQNGQADLHTESGVHFHSVAARLFPIVDPEGKSTVSPQNRPGQGLKRLPGTPGSAGPGLSIL